MNCELVNRAAQAAHEVNRAYCIGLGDHSQKPWDDAEPWQRQSAIDGVQQIVEHPNLPAHEAAEASHAAWMNEKLSKGWTLGPVKDGDKKTHPDLVPYWNLTEAARVKDTLFAATVRGVLSAA